ncbi:uncharacterized protein LOC135931386 isoform X2 [Gordionus sp. m RMFG-2023]|uniref:uncharacterized protein LOC135931386 isoform X2 n=1 Tax=Gordionus sp. m RMFG-2023 TaxID=3053472 RepID=UPI0031FCF5B9
MALKDQRITILLSMREVVKRSIYGKGSPSSSSQHSSTPSPKVHHHDLNSKLKLKQIDPNYNDPSYNSHLNDPLNKVEIYDKCNVRHESKPNKSSDDGVRKENSNINDKNSTDDCLQPVYFKHDGSRFGNPLTLKLKMNSFYEFFVLLKPDQCKLVGAQIENEFVPIEQCNAIKKGKLQFLGINEKYTEANPIYWIPWNTEGYDSTRSGDRRTIHLEFQRVCPLMWWMQQSCLRYSSFSSNWIFFKNLE